MSLIVSTSRLSYWTTTRSFIVARSSGAMSMSGAAVMSIPPLWMLRWRGKPSIRAHTSSQRSQSDSPTRLPPRGWGGGNGSTRATLEWAGRRSCRAPRRLAALPCRPSVPRQLPGPGRRAGAARVPVERPPQPVGPALRREQDARLGVDRPAVDRARRPVVAARSTGARSEGRGPSGGRRDGAAAVARGRRVARPAPGPQPGHARRRVARPALVVARTPGRIAGREPAAVGQVPEPGSVPTSGLGTLGGRGFCRVAIGVLVCEAMIASGESRAVMDASIRRSSLGRSGDVAGQDGGSASCTTTGVAIRMKAGGTGVPHRARSRRRPAVARVLGAGAGGRRRAHLSRRCGSGRRGRG